MSSEKGDSSRFTEFHTNTQKQAKLTVYCLENPTLVIVNTVEMFFKQGTELSTVVTSRGEGTGKKGRRVTQTTVLFFVSGYICHDAAVTQPVPWAPWAGVQLTQEGRPRHNHRCVPGTDGRGPIICRLGSCFCH